MKDIKRLLSFLGPYRKDLLIACAFVFIETSFELFIPALMADLIDNGVVPGDLGYMADKGMQMGLCAILALVTGLMYARFAARAAYGWGARIREAEYRKIQEYAFSDIDKFETSSLVTRLTSDVTIMQNVINGGLRPLVRSPLLLFLGIGLSFSMNAELAVVFIVVTPVLFVILFLILRAVSPMYSKLQRAVDGLNAVVEENVRAIRAVKAFVREEWSEEKFDDANASLRTIGERTNRKAMLNMPSFQLTLYTAIVLIMLLGGSMIIDSRLEVGELTGFLSYAMQTLNSMMMISNVFLLLSRTVASARRISEVLEEESAIKEPEDAVKEMKDGSISFSSVSFRYSSGRGESTLSDISFDIRSGMTVGLVGGTGSGKSTLVQLIPRLYDVDSGSVSVGGVDVRRYDLPTLRQDVSMVLQKNLLFSGSIRENMRWGKKDASDDEIWAALKAAAADGFVRAFPDGLDHDLGQGGVNVSGGQKQRLTIARALLSSPRVLILDDSTSAVDSATERTIHESLKALEGVTKIIIAERISSVRYADMIIVLSDGKVESVGTHEDLMASSRIYQEIYQSQMKGGRNA